MERRGYKEIRKELDRSQLIRITEHADVERINKIVDKLTGQFYERQSWYPRISYKISKIFERCVDCIIDIPTPPEKRQF